MPEQFQIDPKYGDLLISCPVPGVEAEPQRLADFIATEQGQRFGGKVLEFIDKSEALAEQTGMTTDEALSLVSGGAFQLNEEGKLNRSLQEQEAPEVQSPIESAFEETPKAAVEAPEPDPKGQPQIWNPNPAQ